MYKYLALLIISLIIGTVSGTDFFLVKNSKAIASIGISASDPQKENALKTVQLFNSYLKRITGTELPINGEKLENRIQIVLRESVPLHQYSDWTISFPSDKVMQITATEQSLFDALNMILEKGADARFLGLENCTFQYEKLNTLSMPAKPLNSPEGYTLNRRIFRVPNHAVELGLNGNREFMYSHGLWIYAFPAKKYAKGWPEAVMPVSKGKKLKRPPNLFHSWQPCYSNPETARIASENILEIMRSKPVPCITLGVNDSAGYCECEECQKLDAGARKSIFSNDKRNKSASYYTFVNRVAEAVCKEFPELRIGLLAYSGTIMPPPFPVHRNVVPMLTLDTYSAAVDPKVAQRHDAIIAEWGKNAREIGIWEYCWGRNFLVPRVNFKRQAHVLKHLYNNNGRAYFGENCILTDAIDGPKTYLTARLLKDINADVDQLLDDWYARFAGKKAAPHLKELYRLCEKYWLSGEMKLTPNYKQRNYVYMYPVVSHLFALTPEFMEAVMHHVRNAQNLTETKDEKARMEMLAYHFEYLECIAAFRGFEYCNPRTGEFSKPADATATLTKLLKDGPRLLKQFETACAYFRKPDFPDQDLYRKYSKLDIEFNPNVLLADSLLKASCFLDNPKVQQLMTQIADSSAFPSQTKSFAKNLISGRSSENCFSNPGFEKPISSLKIKSAVPYEVTSEVTCGTEKTLRIYPAQVQGIANPDDAVLSSVIAFTIPQRLPPGTWAVSLKVYTEAPKAVMDLAFWRMKNGKSQNWEDLRQIKLQKGKWQTFTQIREIFDKDDGANIILRPSGFSVKEPLYIGDIKLICLGTTPKKPIKINIPPAKMIARDKSVLETLYGEKALVNKESDAHQIGYFTFNCAGIRSDDKLNFVLRAARPADCATGKISAFIYEWNGKNWVQKKNLLWNRDVPVDIFQNITFSISGKQLGAATTGKYRVSIFKTKNTGGIAVSNAVFELQPAGK